MTDGSFFDRSVIWFAIDTGLEETFAFWVFSGCNSSKIASTWPAHRLRYIENTIAVETSLYVKVWFRVRASQLFGLTNAICVVKSSTHCTKLCSAPSWIFAHFASIGAFLKVEVSTRLSRKTFVGMTPRWRVCHWVRYLNISILVDYFKQFGRATWKPSRWRSPPNISNS